MAEPRQREIVEAIHSHYSWLRASILFFIIAGWTGVVGWDKADAWTWVSAGSFLYGCFGMWICRRRWNEALELVE